MNPYRAAKLQAITHCVATIARHCEVDPLHIVDGKTHKGAAIREARSMLAFHLYRCGMSYQSIGNLLQRSKDNARRLESDGAIRMMGEDRQMIDSLPAIPNRIEITTHPPIPEPAIQQ